VKPPLAIQSANKLAVHLNRLRQLREESKANTLANRQKRQSLSTSQRKLILQKTGKRCHICGGKINRSEAWHADHVFAHAHGGKNSIENYLPAHSLCNNYRWFYSAGEFQWILKIGVWMRTRIEKRDELAMAMAEKFVEYERVRQSRRRSQGE